MMHITHTYTAERDISKTNISLLLLLIIINSTHDSSTNALNITLCRFYKYLLKCQKTNSQSPRWHIQMCCFVQPTTQNPTTLHLQRYKRKQQGKRGSKLSLLRAGTRKRFNFSLNKRPSQLSKSSPIDSPSFDSSALFHGTREKLTKEALDKASVYLVFLHHVLIWIVFILTL